MAPAVEKPPIGAAPDSYKVLLSNVPSSATEDTLFAALGQFGRLVQLVLAPDVAGVSAEVLLLRKARCCTLCLCLCLCETGHTCDCA